MKFKQKLAIQYIRAKFKLLSALSPRLAAEKAFELFCTPLDKSPKQTPTVFTYAEPLHLTLNGKKVKGYCWNANQPHKVLILHGFGSAAYKFKSYVLPLVNRGYEVMAFDAPAHGSSEGKSINAIQYSQMIQEVNRVYGPVNSYMAHSFGGLALSLALEKIPHDENTKVVFIAPATETSSAADDAFKLLKINSGAVRKEFDQIVAEIGGHAIEWFSIKRAIKNITAKVLWVHDEGDDVTPWKDAAKIKEQQLPNVEFIVTQGLGHKKVYHDETIKNRVIDFL